MGSERVEIAGRQIGPGQPPYVIAEMSANHLRDFDRAVAIVGAAADAGADAVKLQTYTAQSLSIDCRKEPFCIKETIWAGRTLYDLYREAAMPREWHPKLQRLADELGIAIFSTVYDPASVEFLEELATPAYKIASFELIDLPLLRRVARTGKPILLSTGMASLDEIDEAVGALREAGARQLVLLKCSSAYPAQPEDANLRTMSHLAEKFGVPVGLSDHSLTPAVPVAAVALGASVIEKHLTLSRGDGGPDAAFSLEVGEFRQMVDGIHAAHAALGSVRYGTSEAESASRHFRRSLFAVEDIPAGTLLTEQNVRSIRPSGGLHPRHLPEVLGRTARSEIARGTPLDWDHLR